MLGLTKLALAGLTLGTGLLAGCAVDGQAAASAPSTQGITCTKCQVTWIKAPVTGDKGRIISYRTEKSMVCPDCKDAVANFFATGKFQHTCKTCGESMQICELH